MSKRVITLTENDVLIMRDEALFHVTEGEIVIYSDGTINRSKGEMIEIDKEGLVDAITGNNVVFNMEDVGGQQEKDEETR